MGASKKRGGKTGGVNNNFSHSPSRFSCGRKVQPSAMAASIGDGDPVRDGPDQLPHPSQVGDFETIPSREEADAESVCDKEMSHLTEAWTSLVDAEVRLCCQPDHQLLAASCLSDLPSAVWRERVAMWCYSIADHLGESRSIVSVALSILDRFTANAVSRQGTMDSKRYEVASMTAMFLAVRIAGSGNLSVHDLLSMRCDSKIRSNDIVDLGSEMVKELSWQPRMVTPHQFLAQLLETIPGSTQRSVVGSSARYLLELAVCDLELSRSRCSTVALAAFMNALHADAPVLLGPLVQQVRAVTSVDPLSDDISTIRRRLHRIYSCSYESHRSTLPHVIVDSDSESVDSNLPVNFHSSAAVRSISDDNLTARLIPSEGSPSSKRGCDASSEDLPCLKRSRTGCNLVSLS